MALTIIQNGSTVVGCLPRVGGRVVLLRHEGGENVFWSDPELWIEHESMIPEPGPDTGFKAYNGHTVWVGPQSEWWKHQTINPERSGVWPPDPYLIYSRFSIIAQSDSHIIMEGPKSPVSGVQLVKEVHIRDDGTVVFVVTARNIRSEPISWSLWTNTRFPGRARCLVPVSSYEDVRVHDLTKSEEAVPLDHEITNGVFTFNNKQSLGHAKKSTAKAYITPERPFVAAFTEGMLFIKRSTDISAEKVHPEEAPVEIYNTINVNPEKSLLELEFVGPYTELSPGEEMTFSEEWIIRPATDLEKQTKLLERELQK